LFVSKWNSQIEDALSQDSDDQRMNELTNMFKSKRISLKRSFR